MDTITTELQTLAGEAYDAFEQVKRGDDTITTLRDDAPGWVSDAVYSAHGRMGARYLRQLPAGARQARHQGSRPGRRASSRTHQCRCAEGDREVASIPSERHRGAMQQPRRPGRPDVYAPD